MASHGNRAHRASSIYTTSHLHSRNNPRSHVRHFPVSKDTSVPRSPFSVLKMLNFGCEIRSAHALLILVGPSFLTGTSSRPGFSGDRSCATRPTTRKCFLLVRQRHRNSATGPTTRKHFLLVGPMAAIANAPNSSYSVSISASKGERTQCSRSVRCNVAGPVSYPSTPFHGIVTALQPVTSSFRT